MATSNKRRLVLMGFGLGGNHAEGIDGDGSSFSLSWYLKPASLQTYIDNGHYPAGEMEGCVLVDKISVLEIKPSLSFDAPMLGVLLRDDECSRMADLLKNPSSTLVLAGVAEHNQLLGLLATKAKVDSGYVGLDKVSLSSYTDWWRSHGAIIGAVRDGRVQWESQPEMVAA